MGERQKVLHWMGKLKVLQGELEHSAAVLVAASNLDGAFEALNDAARTFYGSEEDPRRDDERYESHNGAVIVTPMSLRRIAPEVFQALRADTMVRMGDGLTAADIAATKVPTGEQGLKLLEAFEAYAGCVQGQATASEGVSGKAEQLLTACSKRAAEMRAGMA